MRLRYALPPFRPLSYRIIAKFIVAKACGIRKMLNFA